MADSRAVTSNQASLRHCSGAARPYLGAMFTPRPPADLWRDSANTETGSDRRAIADNKTRSNTDYPSDPRPPLRSPPAQEGAKDQTDQPDLPTADQ
ncbi:hypothetical protein AAFF_G00162440 [Aldrovandia affinis]|uniref:Uncharacterized protein n=1 Tax=Aldrovandia affinis TaxID=143900 RepID=A0AAD7SZ33_9TELE|nr:hypothetical protein AAFF_G00162440 [Aldrovandia affinis]